MDYGKYLDDLVAELMADPDWELPVEARAFLTRDLAWGLIFL